MADLPPGFRWLPGMLDTAGRRVVSVRCDGRILTDVLGLDGLPAQLHPGNAVSLSARHPTETEALLAALAAAPRKG